MKKKRNLCKLIQLEDRKIQQLLLEINIVDREINAINIQLKEVENTLKREKEAIYLEITIIDRTLYISNMLEKIAAFKLEIAKLHSKKEELLEKLLAVKKDKEIKLKLLDKIQLEEKNLEAKKEQSMLDALALDKLIRKK